MIRWRVSHLPAAGDVHWKGVLKDFWQPFQANIAEVSPVAMREVIDELDAMLGPHFFPPKVLFLPQGRAYMLPAGTAGCLWQVCCF